MKTILLVIISCAHLFNNCKAQKIRIDTLAHCQTIYPKEIYENWCDSYSSSPVYLKNDKFILQHTIYPGTDKNRAYYCYFMKINSIINFFDTELGSETHFTKNRKITKDISEGSYIEKYLPNKRYILIVKIYDDRYEKIDSMFFYKNNIKMAIIKTGEIELTSIKTKEKIKSYLYEAVADSIFSDNSQSPSQNKTNKKTNIEEDAEDIFETIPNKEPDLQSKAINKNLEIGNKPIYLPSPTKRTINKNNNSVSYKKNSRFSKRNNFK